MAESFQRKLVYERTYRPVGGWLVAQSRFTHSDGNEHGFHGKSWVSEDELVTFRQLGLVARQSLGGYRQL